MAVLAPVDGLVSAVDHALVEHSLEDLDIGCVMLMIERKIRVIPIAEDT